MKNDTDKIIIRYLDNQMTESEKNEFEEKLKSSLSLKKKVDEFKKIKIEFSHQKINSVDEQYFNNVLPRFRNKIEKKNQPAIAKVRFALGIIALFVLSYFAIQFWVINSSDEMKSVKSLTENLSDDELNYIEDYLNDFSLITNSDDLLNDSLLENNLELEKIAGELSAEESYAVVSGYQINNLDAIASDSQLEEAYNELSRK